MQHSDVLVAQPGPSSANLQKNIGTRPRVAVVLSGGGARGFADIGVLDVLDSAHIPVELIVGTSMGAIIGGLYTAGYSPKELAKLVESTNWSDVFNLDDDSHRSERTLGRKDDKVSLLSLRFNGFFNPVLPQAISSGQRLTMLLNALVINARYGTQDDFLKGMKVPFIALATDIVTGTRRLITQGDLTGAMRASATVPLRFYPLLRDSAVLVDGGLLSNVPVDIAKDSAGGEIIVVSNTTAELRERDEIRTPWDVADQVITLMMRKENIAQMSRADIVISPELEHAMTDDFGKAAYYVECGRKAARKSLQKLQEIVAHLPEGRSASEKGLSDNILLPAIRDFRVFGSTSSRDDSILRILLPVKGNILSESSYRREIEKPILEYMRRDGFSLARIDSVRLYPTFGRIEIFLDEGRIGDIMVKGLSSVKKDLVLSEFNISPGDIFRVKAGEQGLRNLTATGYFSFASLELQHSHLWQGTQFLSRTDTLSEFRISEERSPSATSLQIVVEERATSILRLAALADNEFGGQFSMQFANENVFGYGTELSLTGGIGGLSRYANATISTPGLFLSFTTLLLEVYAGFKDISLYSLESDIPNGKLITGTVDVIREKRELGGRIRIGGEIGRLASLTAEIRAERQHSYSVRTQEVKDGVSFLTAVKGEFTLDSRDDGAYPHSGTLFQANYEIGTGILGGTNRYTKIFAVFEPSLPVSRLHTFIPRFAVGIGDRTVPRLEQFSLGGIENFYGLNEYELRGKQMAQASITYQVAIPSALFFPTFVSFRYDLGASWLEPESIKFDAFIHGVGAQIGFKTPIGLARFAMGENFRFAKSASKPLLLNNPIFYFSIGASL